MEQKRRLFACLEEKSFMEEEWMRDRALLRDLLKKAPQASPRELAQATGRSVSWVKKWRKRLREGDPHDHEFLCSHSRAHHAPYFRWDPCVETRIVEMRLSPPEHLGRTPGPRALLYYLPRDPVEAHRGSSFASLQSNDLEAPAEKRVYPAQATEETTARLRLGSHWKRFKWMRKDVSSVSASTKSPGQAKAG
jgi:hypothetical protein